MSLNELRVGEDQAEAKRPKEVKKPFEELSPKEKSEHLLSQLQSGPIDEKFTGRIDSVLKEGGEQGEEGREFRRAMAGRIEQSYNQRAEQLDRLVMIDASGRGEDDLTRKLSEELITEMESLAAVMDKLKGKGDQKEAPKELDEPGAVNQREAAAVVPDQTSIARDGETAALPAKKPAERQAYDEPVAEADVDWEEDSAEVDTADAVIAAEKQEQPPQTVQTLENTDQRKGALAAEQFAANHQAVQAEAAGRLAASEGKINQLRLDNATNSDRLAERSIAPTMSEQVPATEESSDGQLGQQEPLSGLDDQIKKIRQKQNETFSEFGKIHGLTAGENSPQTDQDPETVQQVVSEADVGIPVEGKPEEVERAEVKTPEDAREIVNPEARRKAKMAELKEKIAGLDGQIEEKNKQLKALEDEIKEAEGDVDNENADQAAESVKALEEKNQPEIDKLKEEIKGLEEQKSLAVAELAKLEAEQARFEAQVAGAKILFEDVRIAQELSKDRPANELSQEQLKMLELAPILETFGVAYGDDKEKMAKDLISNGEGFLMLTQADPSMPVTPGETALMAVLMSQAGDGGGEPYGRALAQLNTEKGPDESAAASPMRNAESLVKLQKMILNKG